MGSESLPDGWQCRFENTTYDGNMDREYTRIHYVSEDGVSVRISNVQEPNSFGGWGYLVWTDIPGREPLALVEALEAAKEEARSFMRERAPAPT